MNMSHEHKIASFLTSTDEGAALVKMMSEAFDAGDGVEALHGVEQEPGPFKWSDTLEISDAPTVAGIPVWWDSTFDAAGQHNYLGLCSCGKPMRWFMEIARRFHNERSFGALKD